MALSKEPPFDFGHKRTLQDPPDGCKQWVSRLDFNRVAKFSLRPNQTITVRRGEKDLGTDNQQRIEEINANPQPQGIHWAPAEFQTEGATKLLRTNAQYRTKSGQFKKAIHCVPGAPDTEVQAATEMRVIPRLSHQGDSGIKLSEFYTDIALELGPVFIPADNPDGWVKTYWDHHTTLGYFPDIINPSLTSDIQEDLDGTLWRYYDLCTVDPNKPDKHFSARPNQLPYNRNVQLPTGMDGQYDDIAVKSVAAFA